MRILKFAYFCSLSYSFIQKQGKPSATAVEGAKFSLRANAEAPPVLSKTGKDIFPFYPHNRGMGENMASLTGIKKGGGRNTKGRTYRRTTIHIPLYFNNMLKNTL